MASLFSSDINPEQLVQCPYDKSHQLLRKRLSTHMTKCWANFKKNNPNVRMVECEFNTNHVFPEPERQYHMQVCPDRRSIEEPFIMESRSTELYPIYNPNIETEENWDTYDCQTYDPQADIEKKDVLRLCQVKSASVKRDFLIAERKRHSELELKKRQEPPNQVNRRLPPHQTGAAASLEGKGDLREKIKQGAHKSFRSVAKEPKE